jgi:battenin
MMVFVGLLGGAAYVNIFYQLLHTPRIPEKDREFCINITALANNLGITLACVFILAADNTFLKHK